MLANVASHALVEGKVGFRWDFGDFIEVQEPLVGGDAVESFVETFPDISDASGLVE